jgi:hypothetical protein
MSEIITSIIPNNQTVATLKGCPESLDLKAICVFVATGFFLDNDTFWKHKKVLRPGTTNQLDADGHLITSSQNFQWFYKPDDSMSFSDTVDVFGNLLERVIDKQVGDKKVILPLSGGLDSRTQAVALKALNKNVSSYSYSFKGGYPEGEIAKRVAKRCGFEFKEFLIQPNYLWSHIERLAQINKCYSEFTNPRQMALIDQYSQMGDVFSLGHWGDVLFNDMAVPDDLGFTDQVDILYKKIVKPSGEILAQKLWEHYGFEGDFKDYLLTRVTTLHKGIAIEDSANARNRAFKSTYWAPRWTSINLSIFNEIKPITLPYYDDEICKFICQVPEPYLANRALQIEYVKRRNPAVAKIVWQEQKPFNLFNYHNNKMPFNLPYRVYSKASRMYKEMMQKPLVQRNWEIQFLEGSGKEQLKAHLFQNSIVPKELISDVYESFNQKDKVYHAHAVSMLLTLSVWDRLYNK